MCVYFLRCDITHWDSFICVSWRIHTCDIRVIWRIHMCDMYTSVDMTTHQDSFMCVCFLWRDITHYYSFICVSWRIHTCGILVTWRIYMCDMYDSIDATLHTRACMGWLQWVGSFKSFVSFAGYRLFYRALLHKRTIIFRSLLIVAAPYACWDTYTHPYSETHTLPVETHTCTHTIDKKCVYLILGEPPHTSCTHTQMHTRIRTQSHVFFWRNQSTAGQDFVSKKRPLCFCRRGKESGIHIHRCIQTYTYAYTHTQMHTNITWLSACVCVRECFCEFVRVRVCVWVCWCVYMCSSLCRFMCKCMCPNCT